MPHKNSLLLAAAAVAAIATGRSAPARAQTGNLVSNGQFDDDVVPWTTTFSTYATLSWDGSHDRDGCGQSGAAAVSSNPVVDSGSASFSLCVDHVVGGANYRVQAWFRFLSGAVDGYVQTHPNFFDGPNCTGNPIASPGFFAGVAHPDVLTWQHFSHMQAAPADAESASIAIDVVSDVGNQGALEVLADGITFARSSYIFSDDFEVHSVCRWSSSAP